MAKYIPLDALVAEIRKRLLPVVRDKHYDEWEEGRNSERIAILDIINSLKAKEVGLPNFEQEVKDFCYSFDDRKEAWYDMTPHDQNLMVSPTFANFAMQLAKHFFKLGLSINNPITAADRGIAEEIIINLKRVEQDYRIDLTKEIGWVRNQVKKGE